MQPSHRRTASLRHAPRAAWRAGRALRALLTVRRQLAAGHRTEEVLRRVAGPAGAPRPLPPHDAAAAVRRASVVLRTTCLPQAVAMAALLRGSESPATVVLGARRDASRRWVAHAWVEVAGQAWLDGGVTDFRRLATYAGDADWALVPSPDRLTS